MSRGEPNNLGYLPRSRARQSVFCLASLGFFLSMDITLTTLLIEPMKRDMGLTDVEIGLLQGTIFGIAFGLSSLPLGRLIDRGNRVRLLAIGLALWIVGMIGTGLAPDIAILIISRILLGMVAALLIPAALSLIADLYPPEGRSIATSMFVVGQAGGQAFGVLAGGLAFDMLTRAITSHSLPAGLAPWRALYIGAALLGLLPFLLLSFMREPVRQEQVMRSSTMRTALRELYRYRRFLVPLLAAMLFTQIALQATSVWAPALLTRRFGLTPGQFAGWLSAVMLAGGFLGALAGGWLGEAGRRLGGPRRVLLPALVAAVAIMPLSLFGVAPSVGTVAVLLLGHIFAGSIISTVGVVAITLNIPNEVRGLALGANVLCSTLLGTATAPAAIALVSGQIGGEGMLGTAIASICVPAALLSALCFGGAMRAGTVRDAEASDAR